MMNLFPFSKKIDNEEGYVLIVALLIMVVLTAYGIFALNSSTVEIQISGNDKVQKQTFTQADGGTQAGAMLLEENISCPVGFETAPTPFFISSSEIFTSNYWIIETEPAGVYPSDSQRHIRIPRADTEPHTNLYYFGNTSLSTGNAIQMIAGYEGTGFSAAAGGGQLVTNINSQRIGRANAVSTLRATWRHIIGHEGTCLY